MHGLKHALFKVTGFNMPAETVAQNAALALNSPPPWHKTALQKKADYDHTPRL